jgi:hypothetical protein
MMSCSQLTTTLEQTLGETCSSTTTTWPSAGELFASLYFDLCVRISEFSSRFSLYDLRTLPTDVIEKVEMWPLTWIPLTYPLTGAPQKSHRPWDLDSSQGMEWDFWPLDEQLEKFLSGKWRISDQGLELLNGEKSFNFNLVLDPVVVSLSSTTPLTRD